MTEGAAPWPQEIRLAMTMVGGASLAVWMSGVATETSALTRASRSETGTSGYRKLLDLLRAKVRVDVLTGTSAGGIGAAGLGLAEAFKSSPQPLRDALLSSVSLENLIRDPNEKQPRSLLDGDRLLGDLEGALRAITASGATPVEPPDVTLLMPATMLDGETVRYSDALGNLVRDNEHRMLFRFEGPLWNNTVPAPLALAARSTASFPGAFELSRLPVGSEVADRLHPDMTDYTELTRSHWLTDGGMLVNKPLRPAMREIFERSSVEDVRRLLLYVVPTVEREEAVLPVDPASPPLLGTGLARIASTVINQTISADLQELTEHNFAVSATRNTRVSLAALGLKSGALVDDRVMAAYLERRVAEDAAELVRTATRYYALSGSAAPRTQWATGRSQDLQQIASLGLRNGMPDQAPGALCRAEELEAYRTTALDDSVAAGLQLLNAAFHLFPDQRQAAKLNDVRARLHAARHKAARGVRLGPWVARHEPPADGTSLPDWVTQLAQEWARLGKSDALVQAWSLLTSALRDAAPVLRELLAEPSDKALMAKTGGVRGNDGSELPADLGQAVGNAADAVSTLLEWFGLSEPEVSEQALLSKLLLLHVATRGLLSQPPSVDQRVDLVQVSADTRTLLDLSRQRAWDKLTGLQADFFGAFYKASWRANDWLWGRIDGAGWLVQCLLDPHRLRVLRNVLGAEAFRDEVREAFKAVGWQLPSVADNVPAADVEALVAQVGEELGFLGLDAQLGDVAFTDELPTSLPMTSMVLARARQLEIAQEELPVVAEQAAADAALGNGKPSEAFRKVMATPPADAAATQRAFQACQVSAERFDGERGTMLLTKTLVKAGATGVNAAASATRVPASLQPAAKVAQATGRSAWWVTQGATRLGRPWNLIAAAVTAVAGLVLGGNGGQVLQWVGPPVAAGAVVFLVVSLLTLKRTWRMLLTLLCVLVALALLFAAFLPVLAVPLFGLLGTLVTGWQHGEAPVWWLLVVLLLVLPAVWTPVAALRRRNRSRRPAKRRTRAAGATTTGS
ncbi:patatin-like protein [Amycolatopsis sp. NPDC051903]|uniref:patatin-like protein n=1 Tax=Amycolatopsis sp. NPDC051903 TaxID=3363936 RepID=UPI003793D355